MLEDSGAALYRPATTQFKCIEGGPHLLYKQWKKPETKKGRLGGKTLIFCTSAGNFLRAQRDNAFPDTVEKRPRSTASMVQYSRLAGSLAPTQPQDLIVVGLLTQLAGLARVYNFRWMHLSPEK